MFMFCDVKNIVYIYVVEYVVDTVVYGFLYVEGV